MTDLSATARSTPAGPVLEIAGDLDFHSAPRAREALLDLTLDPGQLLIVDLTALTFCDSTGITLLLAARNHALGHRAHVALAGAPTFVTRVFDITGLTQVFTTYPTALDAAGRWAEQRGA